MPLIMIRRLNAKAAEFGHSIVFFFQFLGHLFYALTHNFKKVTWGSMMYPTLRSGYLIVFPLMIMSMLIGMSLTLSINHTLARYNLQHEALRIAQTNILRNIAPLPIGFVLCVQGGLNLIDRNHPSLHLPPDKVLWETIIPLIAASGLTGLILYTYVFASFICSIFLTFYYILELNINEYLVRLDNIIDPFELSISLIKTFLYAMIASAITGFYYYDVAIRVIPIRKAVSRTITRGLFWMIVTGVFLNMVIN